MQLLNKDLKGNHIRCGKGHRFIAKRLGISVQCPNCGQTALSGELASRYYLLRNGNQKNDQLRP